MPLLFYVHTFPTAYQPFIPAVAVSFMSEFARSGFKQLDSFYGLCGLQRECAWTSLPFCGVLRSDVSVIVPWVMF